MCNIQCIDQNKKQQQIAVWVTVLTSHFFNGVPQWIQGHNRRHSLGIPQTNRDHQIEISLDFRTSENAHICVNDTVWEKESRVPVFLEIFELLNYILNQDLEETSLSSL